MNTFSWLIYLSSVFGGIKIIFITLTLITMTAIAIYSVVWGMNEVEENEHAKKDLGKYNFYPMFIFIGLLMFTILIPDRNTMIAIAASEGGEAVVNSEFGKSLQNEIIQYLKNDNTKEKGK